MPKDPTIPIRDCLAEIAILHEIAARMTLQAFRSDPIVRRSRVRDPDYLGGRAADSGRLARGLPDRAVGADKGHRQPYSSRVLSYLWQVITTDTHALKTVMESMLVRHAGEGCRDVRCVAAELAEISVIWRQ